MRLELILPILLLIVLTPLVVAMILSQFIRWKGFCKYLDWHREPTLQSFDGCSLGGRCPVCEKRVLQDGQGNWFAVE